MYCVKCGKYIEYDSRFCKECEESEKAKIVIQPIETKPVQYEKKVECENKTVKKDGFGLALTSVIMVPFLLILASINCSDISYSIQLILADGIASSLIFDIAISSVNVVATIVGGIISLLLTSKALRLQNNVIQNGGLKHTATYVLTIVGRVLSICALVIIGEMVFDIIRSLL